MGWMLVLVAVIGGVAHAEQSVLLFEDFNDEALSADYEVLARGPAEGDEGDASCSNVTFLDVGLGGPSLVLSSTGGVDPSLGCYAGTTVVAGPFDITGCTTLYAGGYWMELGDEPQFCPTFWTTDAPPAGDCISVSLDGSSFIEYDDAHDEQGSFNVKHNGRSLPVPEGATEIWFALSQYDDKPAEDLDGNGLLDDGLAFDDLVVVCDPLELDCADGLDDDFDLDIDCDDEDCARDEDGDGESPCEGDCDDTSAEVGTFAVEVCDGLDTDCIDGLPADEADEDDDGALACGDDCDDADPTAFPGAAEVCDDGVDNDCDGLTDVEDESCEEPTPEPTPGDDDDSADPEGPEPVAEEAPGCACDAAGGGGLLLLPLLWRRRSTAIFRRDRRVQVVAVGQGID
jgi:hypothetical protein